MEPMFFFAKYLYNRGIIICQERRVSNNSDAGFKEINIYCLRHIYGKRIINMEGLINKKGIIADKRNYYNQKMSIVSQSP